MLTILKKRCELRFFCYLAPFYLFTFLLTILFFILSATIVFKTKCFDGPKFFPDPLKEFQTRLAQAFLSSGNPTQKMLLCQALRRGQTPRRS